MFEEFAGLPLHPLAVHSAVVLVPLLVLASLGYALVPKLRSRLEWAAVLLALAAPVAAVVTVLSGNELQEGLGLPLQGDLADHHDFGTTAMWAAIALGVLTLALVVVRRVGGAGSTARTWLAGVITVLVVLAAVVSAYYVIRAGDLGSRMVWEPRWEQATN